MKSFGPFCVALVGTAATAVADPAGRAIIAAMTLYEKPNYTWVSVVDDHAGSHQIEGKTDPAGITWFRMPASKALAAALGREGDYHVEAFLRGREAGVIRSGIGWVYLTELPGPRERANMGRPRPLVRGSANAGGFGIPGGGPLGAAAPFLQDRWSAAVHGALRFGVTFPHEELALIVSGFATLDIAGEVVTGTLNERGATLLLARSERPEMEPISAQGEFKLWLQQGTVVRYQLRLEGIARIAGRRSAHLRIQSHTTLRDIGATRFVVPAEAWEKLQ